MTHSSQSSSANGCCSLCGSKLHSLPEHDQSYRDNADDIARRYSPHIISSFSAPGVEPDFAHDLLRGAEAIAEFLYGDRKMRRAVYHLYESTNYPFFFKLGSMICLRKSVLLKFIAGQEARRRDK